MGSEMCIRDRPKAKSLSPLVAAITDVTNSGREVPIETIVRPISCLLYTSDAADERSSVDLGGRRIIKKKNTRQLMSVRALR